MNLQIIIVVDLADGVAAHKELQCLDTAAENDVVAVVGVIVTVDSSDVVERGTCLYAL